MAQKTLKDHSRTQWTEHGDPYPGDENVKLGCLQRIADATEEMAKNHVRMQDQINYLDKRCKLLTEEAERLRRSNTALRGRITRLKKQNNA